MLDESGPNPLETLLHLIVDPQIAVLLFTIGTYGIIFELSNPSLIFPGVIGVIAIVLALFAFGTLDANAAGIALMVFAVALFVAEIKIASHASSPREQSRRCSGRSSSSPAATDIPGVGPPWSRSSSP